MVINVSQRIYNNLNQDLFSLLRELAKIILILKSGITMFSDKIGKLVF